MLFILRHQTHPPQIQVSSHRLVHVGNTAESATVTQGEHREKQSIKSKANDDDEEEEGQKNSDLLPVRTVTERVRFWPKLAANPASPRSGDDRRASPGGGK